MAEYIANRLALLAQLVCRESREPERHRNAGTRSLMRKAGILPPGLTLHSEMRYDEYRNIYIKHYRIDTHLFERFEWLQALGDEMLWQQLIGKDYESREELARDLGLALREQRTIAGLTQAELAERINVDEVSVRRWELGLRLPSIETLLQLEAVFLEENQ